MDCKTALPLMHEYLDGDLSGSSAIGLREHLLACPMCKERFRRMEQTVALVKMGAQPMRAPDHVTTKIMLALPPVRRQPHWTGWARKHPAASVAVVFLAVMLTGFANLWNADTQLSVRGNDLNEVMIEGNTVVVPSGKSVHGDLVVENGKVRLDGEVTGNVVVIDGSVIMASTAKIGGEIRQVDELVDWVWFKMNQWYATITK